MTIIAIPVGIILFVYLTYLFSSILEWYGMRVKTLDYLLWGSSTLLNWTVGWFMGTPKETAFSYRLQRYIQENDDWRYQFSYHLSKHLNWWCNGHIEMEQQEVVDYDRLRYPLHRSIGN